MGARTYRSLIRRDAGFNFSAWSHDYTFTNQDVQTAFDNVIINKGELLCANTTPVAGAGPDQTLDCAGPSGAAVPLDGSGSSDVDGDTLAYTWTWNGGTASGVRPTVTLPYGETSVTLSVDDNNGGTDEDTVVIRSSIPCLRSHPPGIIGTSGDNGWYKSDVTMTVDSDACSGVRRSGTASMARQERRRATRPRSGHGRRGPRSPWSDGHGETTNRCNPVQ
jgi:hypothetical protein